MKETNKKDKPDIKNKYYELGWFSTKIKEVKINSLEDICNWIDAMCELADKGSQRQIWGAKKKNDRGMLGILTVCKDSHFDTLKGLSHGIFDCADLKNLLDKIKKCMENTYFGRTKSFGFSKTLQKCNDYLSILLQKINISAANLHSFVERLRLLPLQNHAISCLGNSVYNFSYCNRTHDVNEYEKNAKLTDEFFKKIIDNKEIEVYDEPELEFAKKRIDYLCKNTNYWIIKEILKDPLTANLKKNCEAVRNWLTNGTITFLINGPFEK